MHIPDGYLSPQTYLPLYGITIPILAVAARKVKKTLRSRHVPLLALGAAFSFVIMMFNIPVPGGTSGHAVGAAIVAILLGPWAACLAVSIAVIIQAFLFGDGGLTAIGANCFNMAVVMPFVGYYSYRFIAGDSPLTSGRRCIAGAVAGYLALNAAALYTAIQFGIQPLLATGADGRPLYAPYSLSVAIPAMAVGHLLIFGFVEALVTALVISYIQKRDPELLLLHLGRSEEKEGTVGKLWLGLAMLAFLAPLGIVLPAAFRSRDAWGEWNATAMKGMLGYVPAGMQKIADLWRAPFQDYTFAGDASGILMQSLTYIASAFIGIAVIFLFIRIWGRFFTAKGDK
ncbi:MAG TPA: cobalt transporter CbiM [Geobacteraceae bacterium]